jgi:hypothetical protein
MGPILYFRKYSLFANYTKQNLLSSQTPWHIVQKFKKLEMSKSKQFLFSNSKENKRQKNRKEKNKKKG